ncbi:16S rRNA (cytosine(967)-C(5))-methyltransferase RsmB [Gracilibacillus caseinilyticus]|uniref:16S rRNA (cytosine(967)-C(5))-methyltransferase n=1 Tax=Gracilibacillus caseinilyticus TaxID=2932256 RepID=A0ABY4EVP1_9BACI|nr:16S rRNA (cytosine(967)-C(5))-methyltransferase RsmB [Gracilibacillus caseinilyticus]UOQ47922.1 16S rRNA (cytosine(967)-C(5))-methyltransferase RsmB [Gracilibacillus caseinilyticus]
MTTANNNIREIALDILVRIGDQGGYSHLVIDQALNKHQLDTRDGALLTEIVYGTLQRKMTLAYDLDRFINKKKKMNNWVKWLLYLSIYQMKYLDKVPDHAIIHVAVEIAKSRGHKGIASFVNGILRAAQREGFSDYDDIDDEVKRIGVKTSHPEWLVKRWIEQYGLGVSETMCETNLFHKQMTIRIQPLKTSRPQLMNQLESDGIKARPSDVSDQGIIIEKGNVLKHDTFANAMFTVQDESSMLVAELMDLEAGMTVLDACSAPGGKTTHIAEKMQDNGTVYAYDLHGKKAKLVADKAASLDLTSIQTGQADARKLQEKHPASTFDRILIDAPCTGLGVLRSKPDIKYNKREEDIFQLSQIQHQILDHVAPLLRVNGKLTYSTCTVDKEENDYVIQSFLQQHPEYQVDQGFFNDIPDALQHTSGFCEFGVQIFPQDLNSDGFFITRLLRNS